MTLPVIKYLYPEEVILSGVRKQMEIGNAWLIFGITHLRENRSII